MIFEFINRARQIFFNDAVAGIGANNVQDAIQALVDNMSKKASSLEFKNTKDVTFNVTGDVSETIRSDIFTSKEEAADIVFCSSWYGGFDREAYKAFDGVGNTQWCCQETDDMNGEYIGYNFGEQINPVSVKVAYNNSNGANPSFKIQGCKDTVITENNVWVNLTEETVQTENGQHTKTFYISSDNKYAMYRVLFTAGKQSGAYGVDVYEIVITGEKTGEGQTVEAYVNCLDWTKVSGGSTETYDLSSYKEVLVMLDDGDGHAVTMNIPVVELEGGTNTYYSGAYFSQNNFVSGFVKMDDTKVYEYELYVNEFTPDLLSTMANIAVYAR